VIAGAVSGTDVGPDYLERLGELARETCPPHSVSFVGMLKGQDKWAALCAAEAFALTSHQENFGIAVVEALACATPVLISDKVNIWREIEADGAGLVAPDTLEGSTQLLLRWLSLRASDRNLMKERARACFASRFAVERVAEVLVEVIHKHTSREMATATAE
jgi:glycosyltransferase involved in cell wall biosynthesis